MGWVEKFLRHGLHLFGGNSVDAAIEQGKVFWLSEEQETLGEVKCKVLAIVAGHTYLTFQLLFGGL